MNQGPTNKGEIPDRVQYDLDIGYYIICDTHEIYLGTKLILLNFPFGNIGQMLPSKLRETNHIYPGTVRACRHWSLNIAESKVFAFSSLVDQIAAWRLNVYPLSRSNEYPSLAILSGKKTTWSNANCSIPFDWLQNSGSSPFLTEMPPDIAIEAEWPF